MTTAESKTTKSLLDNEHVAHHVYELFRGLPDGRAGTYQQLLPVYRQFFDLNKANPDKNRIRKEIQDWNRSYANAALQQGVTSIACTCLLGGQPHRICTVSAGHGNKTRKYYMLSELHGQLYGRDDDQVVYELEDVLVTTPMGVKRSREDEVVQQEQVTPTRPTFDYMMLDPSQQGQELMSWDELMTMATQEQVPALVVAPSQQGQEFMSWDELMTMATQEQVPASVVAPSQQGQEFMSLDELMTMATQEQVPASVVAPSQQGQELISLDELLGLATQEQVPASMVAPSQQEQYTLESFYEADETLRMGDFLEMVLH